MRDRDDPITNAVLSDSPYERLQHASGAMFAIPTPKALGVQALLLGLLSLILPLYALFPASLGSLVPTLDPFGASPKLLVLGFFGWSMQVLAAAALVVLTYYRCVRAPMSEQQARTVFDVQRIAAGMSIVTGGIAISLTVGITSMGVGGESMLGTYLAEIASSNPFTEIAVGASVGHLAVLSVGSCLAVLAARWLVVRAFPDA